MNKFEKIEKIASENGGILQTGKVISDGVTKSVLSDFVKLNHFERVAHGIYCSPDTWIDSLYLLQLRCPGIVFSHDTALYLLDMTDREPVQYTVTAKTGYNPSRLSADGIKVFTVKKELYDIGIITAVTPFGHTVNTYNAERTLCDMLRSRNAVEYQVFQDSLKQYAKCKDKNIQLLAEYGKLFHVEKRLREYLEVIL